jgi:P27 family predicted phage terminase small subunit
LRGSWRGYARSGEPEPEKGKPKCPTYFTKDQKAIWRRLCTLLESMNILTLVDGYQLERYCVYYVRWRACEEFVARNGVSYPIKSDDPTYYVVRLPNAPTAVIGFAEHPQTRESHRLDAALKQIEMQFGLTPAARARIQADKPWVPAADSVSASARKRG